MRALDVSLCLWWKDDGRELPIHRRAALESTRLLPIFGERLASVEIRHHSAILKYKSGSYGESDLEQWVIIAWTPCRLGGERPWFVCPAESNGVECGRRVTKLYSAGGLFACRHCHRLAYDSQQESIRHRGLGKARKIRMQLGGSANMFREFPGKPKHMHWRTYNRLRRAHNIAEERTMNGLMRFVNRLHRTSS